MNGGADVRLAGARVTQLRRMLRRPRRSALPRHPAISRADCCWMPLAFLPSRAQPRPRPQPQLLEGMLTPHNPPTWSSSSFLAVLTPCTALRLLAPPLLPRRHQDRLLPLLQPLLRPRLLPPRPSRPALPMPVPLARSMAFWHSPSDSQPISCKHCVVWRRTPLSSLLSTYCNAPVARHEIDMARM